MMYNTTIFWFEQLTMSVNLWMARKFFGVLGNTIGNAMMPGIVEPALGSVVYCDLVPGVAEHSGIYVGNRSIIHLNRHGIVEKVTAEEFISGTPSVNILTGCNGNTPLGSQWVAERAEAFRQDDPIRSYKLLSDNCNRFSASCVMGASQSVVTLSELRLRCEKYLGVNNWEVWRFRDKTNLASCATSTPISSDELAKLIISQRVICRTREIALEGKSHELAVHSNKQPPYRLGACLNRKTEDWWKLSYDCLRAQEDALTALTVEADQRLIELIDANGGNTPSADMRLYARRPRLENLGSGQNNYRKSRNERS